MSANPYRESQRREEPPPPRKRKTPLTLRHYVNFAGLAFVGALCLNVSLANLACMAFVAFAGLFALSCTGVPP